jgi:hypothetical protein
MTEKHETSENRVAPVPSAPRPRSLAQVRGIWRGRIQIADDFDQLPEDIAAAFGAKAANLVKIEHRSPLA